MAERVDARPVVRAGAARTRIPLCGTTCRRLTTGRGSTTRACPRWRPTPGRSTPARRCSTATGVRDVGRGHLVRGADHHLRQLAEGGQPAGSGAETRPGRGARQPRATTSPASRCKRAAGASGVRECGVIGAPEPERVHMVKVSSSCAICPSRHEAGRRRVLRRSPRRAATTKPAKQRQSDRWSTRVRRRSKANRSTEVHVHSATPI